MEETYDVVFFKISQLVQPMDLEVSRLLDALKHLDFVQVGLKPTECQRVKKAVSALRQIGSVRTPADKLACLMMTITVLSEDDVDTDSLMSLLVLTLVRSRVPQLIASVTYMKEFTFQENLAVGQRGFAVSTLDAALQYILESRAHLSGISNHNHEFWTALREGNIDRLVKQPAVALAQVRDYHGNNALLIAAAAGQPASVSFLLEFLSTSNKNDINDNGETPLMLAIRSKSAATTRTLLDNDPYTRKKAIHSKNIEGDSALLLACALDDVAILDLLLPITQEQWDQNRAGQGPLHIAAKTRETNELALHLLNNVPDTNILQWQNNQNETFLHLCSDIQILDAYMKMDNTALDIRDKQGRTAMLAWAANGWVHMIDAFLQNSDPDDQRLFVYDSSGRTCLHHLALSLHRSGTNMIIGPRGLKVVLSAFRDLANVRDTIDGSTPLHLAVVNSTAKKSLEFIRCLVLDVGARVDAVNFRGARPGHLCRDASVLAILDEVALKVKKGAKRCDNRWVVTRASTIDSKTVHYIILSGNPYSDAEPSRTVKRRLEDFMLLRKDILHELPESFLPTLRHLFDPEQIMPLMHPPPMHVLDEAVRRLDMFMDYLYQHPVLHNHDLVRTFVQSPELKRDVILNASLARRHLMIEKICDSYPSESGFGGSDDEEYFFTFAQTTVEPLRDSLLAVVRAGRRATRLRFVLEEEMKQLAQIYQNTASTTTTTTMAIKVCARTTCDTAYGSAPLNELIQGFQTMYDTTDGILMALQRPFWLLTRRQELRASLEQQRESLRRAKSWNEVFSTQEQRRNIEHSKEQVFKTLEKLARTGSQIIQSHQMISDEMAHFQRVHPDQVGTIIRTMARTQLEQEKRKLVWLEQAKKDLWK
ncbi:ankyrin repeat-containing domain protein [Fennellomyces sp. T-0311]|nr:ankyrin repeat-containing domain protein [Fennellomyces sp. T-0311]